MSCLSKIGCAGVMLAGAVVGLIVYCTPPPHKSSSRGSSAANSGAIDADLIEMKFQMCDRDEIRRRFGPKARLDRAATPRVGDHPEGKFYLHEFSCRDELGRNHTLFSGLLYSEKQRSWVYYDNESMEDALKDVTVNGKKVRP